MASVEVHRERLLNRGNKLDRGICAKQTNSNLKSRAPKEIMTCDLTNLSSGKNRNMASRIKSTTHERTDGIPSLDLHLTDDSTSLKKTVCEKRVRSRTPGFPERSLIEIPPAGRPASTGRRLPPIRHQYVKSVTIPSKLGASTSEDRSLGEITFTESNKFPDKRKSVSTCMIGVDKLSGLKVPPAPNAQLPSPILLQQSNTTLQPCVPKLDRSNNFPNRANSSCNMKQRKPVSQTNETTATPRFLAPTPPTPSLEKPQLSSTILSVRNLQMTEQKAKPTDGWQPGSMRHSYPRNRPQHARAPAQIQNRNNLTRKTHPPYIPTTTDSYELQEKAATKK
ncbi:uncharacterized protein LOC108949554 [Ciona intestinalis]